MPNSLSLMVSLKAFLRFGLGALPTTRSDALVKASAKNALLDD